MRPIDGACPAGFHASNGISKDRTLHPESSDLTSAVVDLDAIDGPAGVGGKNHLAIPHPASQQLRFSKRRQRTAKFPDHLQMQALSFDRDIDLLTARGITDVPACIGLPGTRRPICFFGKCRRVGLRCCECAGSESGRRRRHGIGRGRCGTRRRLKNQKNSPLITLEGRFSHYRGTVNGP